MTIDELRKNYPFIAYGNQYQFWEKLTQWYSWLLERIVSERPAKSTDHDWVKLAICFQVLMKDREKLFKKLPKPTKEQTKDEDDPEYPWIEGKWPEKSMPKIREFYKCEEETRKYSRQVAAILTENDYCTKVLKEKTYESRKAEEKRHKRRDEHGNARWRDLEATAQDAEATGDSKGARGEQPPTRIGRWSNLGCVSQVLDCRP